MLEFQNARRFAPLPVRWQKETDRNVDKVIQGNMSKNILINILSFDSKNDTADIYCKCLKKYRAFSKEKFPA
jgi:hypothetical protein